MCQVWISECLVYINSFKFYKNTMRQELVLLPFYRWWNWLTERLGCMTIFTFSLRWTSRNFSWFPGHTNATDSYNIATKFRKHFLETLKIFKLNLIQIKSYIYQRGCCSLDLKSWPKAHMQKARSPACGAIGRLWNLEEVGPSRRKSGYWGSCPWRDSGSFLSLSFLPGCHQASSFA
jgi:hypothetical protein